MRALGRQGALRRVAWALGALLALGLLCGASAQAERPPLLWQVPTDGLDGAGAGQVGNPRGVAANQQTGDVYVAELKNDRISQFSPWGEFIRAWGWDVAPEEAPGDTAGDEFEICTTACKAASVGGGAGQFNNPVGIAAAEDGSVYVYDMGNRRVQKFDPEGEFEWMVGKGVNLGPGSPGNLCTATQIGEGDSCGAGSDGTGPSEFSNGSFSDTIELGPSGNLFVGDVGRIQELEADGSFVGEVAVPGETIQSLALDSAANFYATFGGKEDVHKLSPAGAELSPSFPVISPGAVAVSSVGDVYAVEDPPGGGPGGQRRVIQFDPTGANLIPSDAEEEEAAKLKIEGKSFEYFGEASAAGFLNGLATSAACDFSPDELYVTRYNSEVESNLRAYGPAPDPVTCPSLSEGPPAIAAQYATTVNTDGAVLKAEIDPNQAAGTTYQLEYGTAPCAGGGCPNKAPPSPASLGSEGGIPVATEGVVLQGLAPNTTYHYRFVSENEAGGPVYGIAPEGGEASEAEGLGASFTTQAIPPPLPAVDPCPNAAFRTGLSAFLPGCRAYEMVSPLDKDNGDVFALFNSLNDRAALDQSALSGERMTYSTYRAFGNAQGSPYTSQYLASRTAAGWTNDAISPARGISILGSASFETEYRAFSPDLCSGWILHDTDPILAPGAIERFANIYRTEHCAGPQSYEALTTVEPPTLEPKNYNPELQGTSADGQIAAFRVRDKLTANAAAEGKFQCYESDAGKLRLISVLPSGFASKEHCSVGTANEVGRVRTASVENAVSADGGRIYWTASTGEAVFGTGQIFLRESHKNPTLEVSVGGEAQSAQSNASQFLLASEDGSKAIYAVGNLANGSAELYEFDRSSGESTEIAAGFRGMLGASEDATRIYLVSEEGVDGGEAGQPNLYLHEAGEELAFIAELSAADAMARTGFAPSAANVVPFKKTSRVSPDGLHAAFMSTAPLTGYDNTDAVSGKADAEVFRYDAASGELACVSCNPTGQRPSGRELIVETQKTGVWAAAQIPGWPTQLHASRVLSEDGSRLFFESYEALVARDTNQAQDVYEWLEPGSGGCTSASPEYSPPNEGCLALISSGRDPADVRFIDASANGSDVFFATGLSLLSQDPGLIDVYDARVNGGFPAPPPPPQICQGEACQAPGPAPQAPTPSSQSYSGPGNLKPARKCAKGKRKVKRKGKVRCVKKTHTKRAKAQKQRNKANKNKARAKNKARRGGRR